MNHARDALRRLDELDARAVDDELVFDVGNAAVDDASLDNDRAIAERQPKVVERIELKGKTGFDLRAAAADLFDRHRLEDSDLAFELAEDLNPLSISLVFGPSHPARL